MPARVALIVWGIWVLSRAGGHLGGWAEAWHTWRALAFMDVTPAHWPIGFIRHAITLGLAGALVVAQAGLGWHALGVVRVGGLSRRERAAGSLLAGFGIVGTIGFGLACAGLFRIPLLGLAAFGGIALPGCRRAVAALGSGSPERPPRWWWWAMAPGAVAALRALAPDTHVDSYTYHLATPEAWLASGKLTTLGAGLPQHFPALAEGVAAIPVATGIDTAAPFIHLAVFAAGLLLLRPGWIGAALASTGGLVLMHLPLAKNDLAAAGCLIGGVALALRLQASVLSGLLLGIGCAIKFNGIPLAVAAGGWLLLRRRPVSRLVMAAAAPFVPWMAKSWLLTGDPVYPVLASVLPGVPWDPESTRAVAWMTHAAPILERLVRLPAECAGAMVEYAPGTALWLPVAIVALVRGRGRGLAVIALLDIIVCSLLMPSEWHRLALPGFVLLAVWTAAAVSPWLSAGRWRVVAIVAVAASGWLPLGRQVLAGVEAPALAGFLTGGLDRDGYFARSFTTLDRAWRDLSSLPGVRGVLLVGEIRAYRLPGRPLQERCWGRTWGWALAGESRTARDIARKIRQVGATHLLDNFVTEQFPHRFYGEFEWDDRRLRVWKEYVSRWTRPVILPGGVDQPNGGFVIYTLEPHPHASPKTLPFLPGIAGLIFRVAGPADQDLAYREGLALAAKLPDVLHIRNLAGIGAARRGDAAAAYRWFKPGVDAGIADVGNFVEFGKAALILGRNAEARRALALAREHR